MTAERVVAAAARSTAGTPRLRMPAFSAAIFSIVSPRNSTWSIETGVITLASGSLDHVGGIEPAAEPDFEQQHVGGMPREQQKRRRRLDLEHGDRRVAIGALAFVERVGKLVVADQLAAARRAMRKRSLKRTRCGEV